MLEKCCNYLKQCHNNKTLCCTENRSCELSRVITLHVRQASMVAAPGKQNERAACQKDVLEFKFFFVFCLFFFEHWSLSPYPKTKKKLKLNQR